MGRLATIRSLLIERWRGKTSVSIHVETAIKECILGASVGGISYASSLKGRGEKPSSIIHMYTSYSLVDPNKIWQRARATVVVSRSCVSLLLDQSVLSILACSLSTTFNASNPGFQCELLTSKLLVTFIQCISPISDEPLQWIGLHQQE